MKSATFLLISLSAILLPSCEVDRCEECTFRLNTFPTGPDTVTVTSLSICGNMEERADEKEYWEYRAIEYHQMGYQVAEFSCP